MLQVEFAVPASWHCSEADGCVTCRNVGAEAADVLIRPAGGLELERRRLPPGAGLSICGPPDGVAQADVRFARPHAIL